MQGFIDNLFSFKIYRQLPLPGLYQRQIHFRYCTAGNMRFDQLLQSQGLWRVQAVMKETH